MEIQSKKKVFIIIIAVLAICLGAFAYSRLFGGKGGGPSGSEAARYLPSKPGNQWVYSAKMKDASPFDIVFSITGNEKINGINTVVYEGFAGGRSIQKEYYEIAGDALLVHRRVYEGGSMTANLDPPEPMLKFPLEPGKSWDWEGIISGNFRGKFSFKVQDEEEVEVSAGKFRAFKVEMTGAASDSTEVKSVRWFARDTGMIKDDSSSGQTEISAELKQYTINGRTYPKGAKPAEIPVSTPVPSASPEK